MELNKPALAVSMIAAGALIDANIEPSIEEIIEPQVVVEKVIETKEVRFEDGHHAVDKFLRDNNSEITKDTTNADLNAMFQDGKKFERLYLNEKALNQKLSGQLNKTNSALKQYVEATRDRKTQADK